jgi:MraZ protein
VSEALGSFPVKLDDKFRLILPSRARGEVKDQAYLTKGQDKCVYLFSAAQFADYRQRIRARAPEGMPALAFDRVFYSSVVTAPIDKQNRVTLPLELRKYAGLERELTVVGLEERLEIWDAQRWQDYMNAYVEQFAALEDAFR